MRDLLKSSDKLLKSYSLIQSYKKLVDEEVSNYLGWLSCYVEQFKNEIHKTLTNFICVESFDYLLFTNSINCIKIKIKVNRNLSENESNYTLRVSLIYRDIENRDSIYECCYDNNSCCISDDDSNKQNIELKEFTEFFIQKLKEINKGDLKIADQKIEIEYLDTPENNEKLLEIQKEYNSKISKLPLVIQKIEEIGYVLNSKNIYEKKFSFIKTTSNISISIDKEELEETISITYSFNESIVFNNMLSTYFCEVVFTDRTKQYSTQKENNFLSITLHNGRKEKYTYQSENIKSNILQILSNLLIIENIPGEIGTIIKNLVK